jgi:hypothetical protein
VYPLGLLVERMISKRGIFLPFASFIVIEVSLIRAHSPIKVNFKVYNFGAIAVLLF